MISVKMDDFDKLYREHKKMEADYKRMGLEFDRQQHKLKEMLKEVRTELAKKKEALVEEKTKAVDMGKLLEEAAKEKLELNKKNYDNVEWANLVLNKLQTTYQHQVIEYECQDQVVAAVIIRLKGEKQEAEDSSKLGVDRIRHIMSAWWDRTRTSINACLAELWKEWSQQAAKLQTLRANAENQKKAGDQFYKMDEESIVTIREELSNDFFSLAESHLGAVRGLVERLDDD